MSIPRCYAARVRNALVASPMSVDLRNLGGGGTAFFAGGAKLNQMCVTPMKVSTGQAETEGDRDS